MNIFHVAAVLGFFLPSMALIFIWPRKALRRALLIFILFQLAQIGSESLLAHLQLRHFIKYTALCFVLFRIYQLLEIWRLRTALTRSQRWLRTYLMTTFAGNIILWPYIAFRLLHRIF